MLLEAVAHEAAGLTGPAAAHALSSAAACAQSSTPMPSLSDVLHILQLSLAEELLLLVTLWSEPGSVSMKTESMRCTTYNLDLIAFILTACWACESTHSLHCAWAHVCR